MTDNLSGQEAQGQASPQPQTASATPQEPQSQEQKPIDEATVRAIATEVATRTAQSLVDKAEYRISQKAQQQIQALEINKSTLGLSDQQVQDAKLKIIANDVTPSQEAQAGAQPVSQGQPMADPVSEASFITELFKATEAGMEVTPNDPEFSDFNKVYTENFNDPSPAAMARVTRAVEKAAAAKKQRIENQQAQAEARTLGGGGGLATGSNDAPASDLWRQAYRK
jgi:hypothetical protein